MKLRLQNYTVIMLIEKSSIKFNSYKLNSVPVYEIVHNYRNLHRVVQHLCQYNLKILHLRHIRKLRQRK
jgi:hypothetical protein